MFSASRKDMMQQMAAMMADRFQKSTPYSKRFSKSLQQGKVESSLPLSQRSSASSELAAPCFSLIDGTRLLLNNQLKTQISSFDSLLKIIKDVQQIHPTLIFFF